MKKKTFEMWKKMVDDIVFVSIGYHLDDLPDEDFYVNYEENLDIYDMAKIVIDNFTISFYLIPTFHV